MVPRASRSLSSESHTEGGSRAGGRQQGGRATAGQQQGDKALEPQTLMTAFPRECPSDSTRTAAGTSLKG